MLRIPQSNISRERRDGFGSPSPSGSPVGLTPSASEGNRLEAERAIDDVLADSFPASDPPSWNAGVSRPEPAASDATPSGVHPNRPMQVRCAQVSSRRRAQLWEKGPSLTPPVSLAGAAGIALLVPFAILVIGTPVALTVRGLLEAIGWLFGVVAR